MLVHLALRLVTAQHVQIVQLALLAHLDTTCQVALVQHVLLQSLVVPLVLIVQPAPAAHRDIILTAIHAQPAHHQ
jgi:hypothetical protein